MTESRHELLNWINDLLSLNYTKIEQCGTGGAYCQIIDSIYRDLPISRVKFHPNQEYEYLANFKILQSSFSRYSIDKNIPVERLIKCKYQDNFEFLQWIKKYWDTFYPGGAYDAVLRRGEVRDMIIQGPESRASTAGKQRLKAPLKPQFAQSPQRLSTLGRRASKKTPTLEPLVKQQPQLPLRPSSAGNVPGRSSESAALMEDIEKLKLELSQCQSVITELNQQTSDVRTVAESLERERDFYFGKLRSIEVIINVHASSKACSPDVKQVVGEIRDVLYQIEDGFEMPGQPPPLLESVIMAESRRGSPRESINANAARDVSTAQDGRVRNESVAQEAKTTQSVDAVEPDEDDSQGTESDKQTHPLDQFNPAEAIPLPDQSEHAQQPEREENAEEIQEKNPVESALAGAEDTASPADSPLLPSNADAGLIQIISDEPQSQEDGWQTAPEGSSLVIDIKDPDNDSIQPSSLSLVPDAESKTGLSDRSLYSGLPGHAPGAESALDSLDSFVSATSQMDMQLPSDSPDTRATQQPPRETSAAKQRVGYPSEPVEVAAPIANSGPSTEPQRQTVDNETDTEKETEAAGPEPDDSKAEALEDPVDDGAGVALESEATKSDYVVLDIAASDSQLNA
ncbi:uncharacterized protein BJ171DRAFT_596913 [Polychytrium aggregatum]|uniref:uncharacterized protein n=1 Tax=Polychytrium aggregatum TaxID=110093 RepID=UPI0022FF1D0C|nr:uncharacterized protein BJ171DRAFT_596913 [Polychytrium aggregatum]KAI9207363.1 hypothetical protein BJ171DRAFT_596913 [Polychytrium aggregatum]